MEAIPGQEPWLQVAEVVRLIRQRVATTRPELARVLRLGRNVISDRIQMAEQIGLVRPSSGARSRTGRRAEVWEFCAEAGTVLVATVGAGSFSVALTRLDGVVLARTTQSWDLNQGPDASVARIADVMRELLGEAGLERPWAIGIGLPVPIDAATGRNVDPVAPSAMSYRWPTGFDVRAWFVEQFRTPTWVDSVINFTTLGAVEAPGAPGDLVYVRIGTGLGAGLVSGGRVHRGATSVAGELNHVTMSDDPDRVCLCGRIGCLETYAGGWAMLGDARRAAARGDSPHLARIAGTRELTVADLDEGVRLSDPASVEIVVRAATMLGRALATVVTLFNPARVVLGGSSIARNELLLSVVERTVQTFTLPASFAAVELVPGEPDNQEALRGGAVLVAGRLLSAENLPRWGALGSPLDAPVLLEGRALLD